MFYISRSFRSWKFCVFFLCIAIAACSAKLYFFPAAFGHNWTPIGFSYLRGYRLGISQAKKDIAESRAMVLDPRDVVREEFVDRASGLNLRYMGDVTDQGSDGYVQGYNATVKSFIREKGIPAYSWKRWESIIFNAGKYFDRRLKIQQPLILREGSTGFKSLYSSAMVTLQISSGGSHLICLGSGFGKCDMVWPISPLNGELQCVWGPEGSHLLFVRGTYGRTNNSVIGIFVITTEIRVLRFEYKK